MATTAKLVGDVEVLLRGMRAHEGLIESRRRQAADSAASSELAAFAAEETLLVAAVAQAASDLGGPGRRLRPAGLPSLTTVVGAVATQTQPFGEALLVEAAAVRLLADRAAVARTLADALDRAGVVAVADRVHALYPRYAEWLVAAASELVVDENSARLTPSFGQRLAGRAKDAAGVPFRVRDVVVRRAEGVIGGVVGRPVHEPPAAPVEVPITGYDDRTASDIVSAVADLGVGELATVRAYEQQHKGRKTVLDATDRRAEQLQTR